SFEVDPSDSLQLDEPLKALGMPLAFDRDNADFMGMTRPTRREHLRRPYLGGVYHKVRIKLDAKNPEGPMWERGFRDGSVGRLSGRFHTDHPFLFIIRDVRSGMILFIGRVVDPTVK